MNKYDLTKILPQKPPMILLDDILEINLENQTLVAKFDIYPEKIFFDKNIDGINSLAGIEFMAQTIGCYAFFKNKCNPPKPGLLLGTRLYNNSINCFKNGKSYTAKVHEIFDDGEIVVFDCLIYDDTENEIASATINAYQGGNTEELLNGK